MPATPTYSLPYPAPADPADVPTDMGKLANAIDALPGLGYWFATDASTIKTVKTVMTGKNFAVGVDGGQATVYFGGAFDASLFRQGANDLRTPGQLVAGAALVAATEVTARSGSATQGYLGNVNGAAGLLLGSPGDTNLYRAAAGQLKTDGGMQVLGALVAAWTGSAWGLNVAADGHAAIDGYLTVGSTLVVDTKNVGAKLAYGSAQDTTLYRSLAGVLKTDGSLVAVNSLQANNGQLVLASSGLTIAGDTNLYRAGVGQIVTDKILSVGYSNAGGLYFGNAGDVSLTRPAANILQLNGWLNVAGSFSVLKLNGPAADTGSLGGTAGQRGIYIGDTSSYPSGATNGGYLYSVNGRLHWIGSDGVDHPVA